MPPNLPPSRWPPGHRGHRIRAVLPVEPGLPNVGVARTGRRVIEEQLAPVRRYTRAEAAQALNIKDTWLKRWVTARCIPHQRSGDPNGKQQRGVWFTWNDILAIGAMLPELMTNGQAGEVARSASASGPSDELLDRWARLSSAR